jgi:superoxide dismutase, Fe-Mn family
MSIELPPLPFERDALAPFISEETLEYHYGKHHQAYVTNLNKMIAGSPNDGKSLEDIIQSAEGGVFNNAAQIWNHSFYWEGLKRGVDAPSGALAKAIEAGFGSLDTLKEELATAAATQFGSGWAWLVADGKALKVVKTPNADLPLKSGQKALWNIDVWEHAYYVDYRNARPKYIEDVLGNLINWSFVAENFEKAMS